MSDTPERSAETEPEVTAQTADVAAGPTEEDISHEAAGDDGEAEEEVHGILAFSTLPEPRRHRVLVYSSAADVRARVRNAVGTQAAADLGPIEWSEASTAQQVITALDAGGLDLVLVDGEARPTGGLGLAKQLKDEIRDCPPFVALIARRDDRWLARWSLADAVVAFPVDAPALTSVVAEQLRARESGQPVQRAFA